MPRSKSPSPRASPKSSPRRKTPGQENYWNRFMRNIQNNTVFWIYSVIVVLVVLWGILYGVKDDGWWDGVSSYTPSWGDSQALILVFAAAFYLSMSYISFKLSMLVRDRNSQLMLYSAFALLSLLAAAFMYVMADGRERYSEAFYIMLLAAIVSLFILYFAAIEKDAVSLWVGVAALALGAYLTAWSYEVKNNSGQ